MTEFVGRTGAQRAYSYPETRRGGGSESFARNFASGPKEGDTIPIVGSVIVWNAIDAGDDPSTDVPITAAVTGIIRISAVIAVVNPSGTPRNVIAALFVDDVAVPTPSGWGGTVAANGALAFPILAEVETTVGVTSNITVIVTPSVDSVLILSEDSSTIDIQEVSVATG